MLRRLVGGLLKRTVYRPGTTATILRGPLRGCRYVVNARTGWAPLVGALEPEAQRAYCQLVRPGDVVYDLGANVGIHSLLFSRLVGERGRVFAFEPVPANGTEIERMKRLNQVDNIELVGKAVADRAGRMRFGLGSDPSQGSLLDAGADGIDVDVTTLDDWIDAGHPTPDFLKIDIEGAESLALAGFARTLERVRPTFAIDLHSPEQDLAVGSFLADRSYRLRRLNGGRSLFTEIRNPRSGWPDPDGAWGTIVATPP